MIEAVVTQEQREHMIEKLTDAMVSIEDDNIAAVPQRTRKSRAAQSGEPSDGLLAQGADWGTGDAVAAGSYADAGNMPTSTAIREKDWRSGTALEFSLP